MASPLSRYGFINAKLRARISKIITEEFVTQLVKSRSLPDCLALLKNSSFSEIETIYNQTGDLKMCELTLQRQEIDLFTEMRRYLKDEVLEFTESLILQFETANLKNATRLWFDRVIRKRPVDYAIGYILRRPILNKIDYDAVINAGTIDDIVNVLQNTPYAGIFASHKDQVMQQSSLFRLEIALDHWYYNQVFTAMKKLPDRDQAIAKRLLGVQIDLLNISWLVRFKSLYNLPADDAMSLTIPFGISTDEETLSQAYKAENAADIVGGALKRKYGSVQALLSGPSADKSSKLDLLENVLDQILFYEVRHILSGYPFTIGIILAYFILKQEEIRKIMTILNAKYYNLEEERLAGRL
jgi:V/A-type H+/Na+-transporting ATPase subunit C